MKLPKDPIVSLGGADKKGYCPVRIRVNFGERIDLYTGITVLKSQWDKNNHRVKHGCEVKGTSYAILNNRIKERINYVKQFFNNALLREDEHITVTELKKQYNFKFNKSEAKQAEEFFYILHQYIEEQANERNWTKVYKGQWDTLYKDLKDFAPKLKFSGLSKTFMNSYVEHLAERMSNDKIKEYLKKLREFVNSQTKHKFPINSDFYEFKPKLQSHDKDVRYLNKEELQRIISLDYTNNQRLDRVRDVFVFMCCTSLRYSDVKALTRDNIRENDRKQLEVLLVTQKDKGKVWFPLPEVAMKIYNKYKDYPYPNNKAFRVISDQKFRDYLKEVGADAKIEGESIDIKYKLGKKITVVKKRSNIQTHDARRTFIVLAINAGASFEKIALFTSHSEVKQMMPYMTLTQEGKEDVCNIINDLTAIAEP